MTGMEQSSYPRRRFHILGHRAHLRRHITLVMLRKDAVGDENPVGAHPAVGDHAALLAEQVGDDALIFDRHRRLAIGRDETDRQALRSEEPTSELQSLIRSLYAVFRLSKTSKV